MTSRHDSTRLTGPDYWNKVHADGLPVVTDQQMPVQRRQGFLAALGRFFHVESYAADSFWKDICPRYLPAGPARVLEIGCAPGAKLTRLAKTFGYEPYGVDFSVSGVEATKRVFRGRGFDPENVLQADLFDEEHLAGYQQSFDVVMSFGFIEHFTDPSKAIERHVAMLRGGGLLVVSIPNLRGLNFALTYLLDRRVLALHNLQIMKLRAFRDLFERADLEPRFCGYYGKCYLGVCIPGDKTGSPLARIYGRIQQVIDLGLKYVVPANRLLQNRSSPYLLYIGVKRGKV